MRYALIIAWASLLIALGTLYATKGIPVMCGDNLCPAIKIRGN